MVSSNTVCLRSKEQGSYTFSGQKFRNFPPPYFEILRAFLLCWKLCFVHTHVHMQKRQTMRAWKHVKTRHSLCIFGSMDMRESKERALGTQNECFDWLSFTLKLVSVYIFRSRSTKNQVVSRTKKPISSTFKALEIGPLNLKGFQDAFELRNEKY